MFQKLSSKTNAYAVNTETGLNSKNRRNSKLGEITDRSALRNHLIYNNWSWLKDGETWNSFFNFDANGTYEGKFSKGTWEAIDHKNFWFRKNKGTKYSL